MSLPAVLISGADAELQEISIVLKIIAKDSVWNS